MSALRKSLSKSRLQTSHAVLGRAAASRELFKVSGGVAGVRGEKPQISQESTPPYLAESLVGMMMLENCASSGICSAGMGSSHFFHLQLQHQILQRSQMVISRVGQNHIYIYARCVYGIICRGFFKYTVIYGVCIYTILANPSNKQGVLSRRS